MTLCAPPVHANLSHDSVMLRLACEAGSLANFVERILFFAKWKHDMIEMLETHVTLQSRNFTSRVAKETRNYPFVLLGSGWKCLQHGNVRP